MFEPAAAPSAPGIPEDHRPEFRTAPVTAAAETATRRPMLANSPARLPTMVMVPSGLSPTLATMVGVLAALFAGHDANEAMLEQIGRDRMSRAEALAPAEFIALAEALP